MIETARKEDLFLDKKLIIPKNKLDAIRIMARLHPVVGDQPTHEKDQPNTNNPILDLACTIANIHEMGIGVHADLRVIQNEPPEYYFGKGFMSGISSLKGNGILAVFGQWRDVSGKYAIKQFFYTDTTISYRNAFDAKTWSGWIDILTSNSSLDYNKLLNVPITSTLSDDKTKIASIFAVNQVNRTAVNAQKTANTANANAVDAMNEALKKMDIGYMGLGRYAQVMGAEFTDFYSFPLTNPEFDNFPYQTGFYTLSRQMVNGWKNNGGSATYTCVLQVIRRAYLAGTALVLIGYEANRKYINERHSNGVWQGWREDYSTYNTTVGNHGQLHNGTKVPKDLLAVGDYGFADYRVLSLDDLNLFSKGLTFNGDPSSSNSPFGRAGSILQMGGYAAAHFQLHFGIDHRVKFRKGSHTDQVWGDINEFYTTVNTTPDPSGFLRSFGNAVALTTDKLTSDLRVDRSDLVASAKYAYDVHQAALSADKKATKAQSDATTGINNAATADKKAQTAQVTANTGVANAKTAQTTADTGVANAKTAQTRADAAFSRIKPITEGGTGATTAANARKNLGLGDASTRNVAASLSSNGNTLVPLSLMKESIWGIGYSLVDVTSQRIANTPYVNDTDKVIFVLITANYYQFKVNDVVVASFPNVGDQTSATIPIAPGDKYSSTRIGNWFEFRPRS